MSVFHAEWKWGISIGHVSCYSGKNTNKSQTWKWEEGASLHEQQELLFQQGQCDRSLSALGVSTLPWELILDVLGRGSSINRSAKTSVGKQ